MKFTTEQIALLTIIIGATATVTASIIAATVAIMNNKHTRKSEHKLSILRILLDAAYKEYEFRTQVDYEKIKNGEKVKIKSFTEYIIFYMELSNLFNREYIDEQALITSLKRNKILIDVYYRTRESERPDYHKKSN